MEKTFTFKCSYGEHPIVLDAQTHLNLCGVVAYYNLNLLKQFDTTKEFTDSFDKFVESEYIKQQDFTHYSGVDIMAELIYVFREKLLKKE